MMGFGGVILKQARKALKAGRLEEAHRLLTQTEVKDSLQTSDLFQQLHQALLRRGEKHLRNDAACAAWEDLLRAEQLGITDNASMQLRQALERLDVARVRALLQAGEPARAQEVIAKLRQHGVRRPELDSLEELACGWSQSCALADLGEFGQALQVVERLSRFVTGPAPALQRWIGLLLDRQQVFPDLLLQLHDATSQENWHDVLHITEQILRLAPQHGEARKLRSKAWRAIEPPTLVNSPARRPALANTEVKPEVSLRLMLWVDGLGGFLVCLGNRVSLGQAAHGNRVDIPIQAELGRIHAWLVRDGEGYILEALRPVKVNDQLVDRHLLQSGDVITLGSSCQLRLDQPVSLSSTARLEMVSPHRFKPTLASVLLMADTLVIGGSQTHIPLPVLGEPLILFRHRDGLGVRHQGQFCVDGELVENRAPVEFHSTITGADYAITLEPLDGTWGS